MKVENEWKPLHILGYILFACLYWIIQVMVFVNLFYSDLAMINAGIISGIWNIMPLFVSIVDFCVYGQRLQTHHLVGVFSLVVSALCISLAGINGDDNTAFKYDLKEPLVKAWIPVLLGVLTPCFFATNVIFVKHLSGERVKFDSTTLTFST